MDGFQHRVLCAWQLSWLAVEWPWSALAELFLTLLAQMSKETIHTGAVGSFQAGGACTG